MYLFRWIDHWLYLVVKQRRVRWQLEGNADASSLHLALINNITHWQSSIEEDSHIPPVVVVVDKRQRKTEREREGNEKACVQLRTWFFLPEHSAKWSSSTKTNMIRLSSRNLIAFRAATETIASSSSRFLACLVMTNVQGIYVLFLFLSIDLHHIAYTIYSLVQDQCKRWSFHAIVQFARVISSSNSLVLTFAFGNHARTTT